MSGSDRRGTIYGLYDVSEQIGVSPYHFWADVPTQKHERIFALNATKVQGPPSVKYRGFFINDEAPGLTTYVNSHWDETEYGSPYVSGFYESVFELLLRLRANYLWPAMWASMFNVDDPLNPVLADYYGIVMGTSHTEPLARATNEWKEFGKGEWQWNTNNESIYPFFVEGAERALLHENLMTMAMRGEHDTALDDTPQIDLLEDVVAVQRDILDEVYGAEGFASPAQTWCLYKEVQAYYDRGMRVPDDITLLWSDDNWGNIRRLPLEPEYNRSGGAGVYYHFDYVGGPRNYKWHNQVQFQRTWQQMDMAYQRRARDIWIVNVGDIKPMEIPLNHFLDMAYDISPFKASGTIDWLSLWAERDFGREHASEIADIVDTYAQLANRRKYEMMYAGTYSLINYNEWKVVLAEWTSLRERAQKVSMELAPEARVAFFEMVLHGIEGGAIIHEMFMNTAKNRLYASKGRTSTNAAASRVLELFEADRQLTEQFDALLDGKWFGIMSQTHLGYDHWQQPKRQVSPALQYIIPRERALSGDMALMIEGSNASVPGDDRYHPNNGITLTLDALDPYGPFSRWIEIFSVGPNDFAWNITSNATFARVSQSSGTIAPTPSGNFTAISDTRVYIAIDWSACPAGNSTVEFNVSSSRDYGLGNQYDMPSVYLPIYNRQAPSNFSGFVEGDSHVSMEVEHYSTLHPSNDSQAQYLIIPGYGRTLSGVTITPDSLPSLSPSTGPALAYSFYTFTPAPNANITLRLGPSLNADPSRPLRYALAIDDNTPVEVQPVTDLDYADDTGSPAVGWETAVADAGWANTTMLDISTAGAHTLYLWALEPGVVFEKIVIDLESKRDSYLGPPESVRV